MAHATVSLSNDDRPRLDVSEKGWFFVHLGGIAFSADDDTLDVAEAFAGRILEGVAKLREIKAVPK